MIAIQIAGGVALVLFAVRFLRKGLDRLFGQHLMVWMEAVTSHRLRAFVGGIVAGAVAPSSTALSVMLIQLLNASQLSAARTLSVLLGANIGITVMVQLLSFSVSGMAAMCILLGVVGFQGMKRPRFRGIGQCLLSLGFVFLAMSMISNGAAMLNPAGDFAEFMRLMRNHPIASALASAVVAFLLQSSTATIALGIGFAVSTHAGMSLLVPWVLGTNLGIALTALAAGWSTLEGRRLAVSNLLVKTVATAAALAFLPEVTALLGIGGPTIARQGANFHTFFNVAIAAATLPLVGPLSRLVEKMIVPPVASAVSVPLPQTFLDLAAVETPAFALAQATRELLAMGDEVKSMLQTWRRGFVEGSAPLLRLAVEQDARVDATYHKLTEFLSLVREHDPSEGDAAWHMTLLTFSNELEDIGDIISTDLCTQARKALEFRAPLTPEDSADLDELYHRLTARYDIAMSILTTRDTGLARSFLSGKEALDQWCRERQRLHYERLRGREDGALRSSSIYLEMLNDLRRINSHLSVIGYAVHAPSGSAAAEVSHLPAVDPTMGGSETGV